jgi:hypothetical protein
MGRETVQSGRNLLTFLSSLFGLLLQNYGIMKDKLLIAILKTTYKHDIKSETKIPWILVFEVPNQGETETIRVHDYYLTLLELNPKCNTSSAKPFNCLSNDSDSQMISMISPNLHDNCFPKQGQITWGYCCFGSALIFIQNYTTELTYIRTIC